MVKRFRHEHPHWWFAAKLTLINLPGNVALFVMGAVILHPLTIPW
jgi:hypothetical protein